jgi:hypothetical protein
MSEGKNYDYRSLVTNMSDLTEVYGPDFVSGNSNKLILPENSSKRKQKHKSSSRNRITQSDIPDSNNNEKLIDELHIRHGQDLDAEKRRAHNTTITTNTINIGGKTFVPRFIQQAINSDAESDTEITTSQPSLDDDLDESAVQLTALKGGSRGVTRGSHIMAGQEDDIMALKEDVDFARELDANLRAATESGGSIFGGMTGYDAGDDAYGKFVEKKPESKPILSRIREKLG